LVSAAVEDVHPADFEALKIRDQVVDEKMRSGPLKTRDNHFFHFKSRRVALAKYMV
jgi:hypothetical protein